jgi:predicted nucleotidyltransferase component of viral defense system
MSTLQENVELFHLLFLRHLEGKLDRKLYALKGGCNLRFFFKSIRYSEDIDFDVAIISKTTLQNKIDKIIDAADFKQILRSRGIQIMQAQAVKQTDTTQRWKLLLQINNSTTPVPTKIEFSRRHLDDGIAHDPIDPDVIRQHNLYPIICNHYSKNTAFLQKIKALIYRTETQARDIFDLKWLLDSEIVEKEISLSKDDLNNALKNLQSIHFDHFKSQVVSYLMPEYQAFYDNVEQWDTICLQVIAALEETNRCN